MKPTFSNITLWSIVILLCSPALLLGQSNDSSGIAISVNAGATAPKGAYGSSGACAVSGPLVNLYATYPVKGTIYHATGYLGYLYNNLNYAASFNNRNEKFTGYLDVSGAYDQALALMPGLAIDIPKKWKQVSLEFRFMAGAAECFYSARYYFQTDGANIPPITTQNYLRAAHTLALAFDVGIGINVYVSHRIFLKTNADFFATGGAANTTDQVTHSSGNVKAVSSKTGEDIEVFSATLGIGYRFGK